MKTRIIKKLIGIVFILAISGGLLFVVNKQLFSLKKVNVFERKLDLPLSRCTVAFDEDVLKKGVIGWAELKGRTISCTGDKKEFVQKINPNGLAESLSKMYSEFVWDAENASLTMPREGQYLIVPTWVLVAFYDGYKDE